MKRFLFLAALSATGAVAASAHSHCADARRERGLPQARITLAAAEEGWYDVQHVKLDLSMSNSTTAISGNATTTAKVTASTMPVYAFELDSSMTIDSFRINGTTLTVSRTGAVCKATLPTALSAGAVFTATTWYHGTGPNGGGNFFTRGLNQVTLGSGTAITYTLSDMYTAQDWWPCKQDIRDKIVSTDLWLTVPAGTMGCANGVRKAVTPVAGGKLRYEWKHRFPVKYYLISAAVAPYIEKASVMSFPNGDTLKLQNFVYDTAGLNASTRLGLDSLARGIRLFSDFFGRYPFYGEKYGNCIAPLGGGMEHQTATTLGYNVGESTTMHELGHQWWGDCVSQGTWRDIWLSEGFATYCEQLYAESIYGAAAAQSLRTAVFNGALTSANGTVYVDDTVNASRVFDYNLTYQKGASVAHMLRQLAPADSLFFRACRQYQQTYRYRNATTADLQAVFQTIYNRPLDTFFQQWVYGKGYPVYAVKWNWKAGVAYVQLTQTQTAGSSTALFSTPIDVQLKTANGNQTVRVYNNTPVQLLAIPLTDPMTGVALDPTINLLYRRNGLFVYDATLNTDPAVTSPLLRAFPNPARAAWTVEGLKPGTALILADATGRTVWAGTSSGTVFSIPADTLSTGNYLLYSPENPGNGILLTHQ